MYKIVKCALAVVGFVVMPFRLCFLKKDRDAHSTCGGR
jgi:hypothetical protein